MALALVSISLGVATLVASQILSRSTSAAMENTSTHLAGQADLQVANGNVGVDLALLPMVRATPGVRAAVPFVMQRVTIDLPNEKNHRALLLGIDRESEALIRSYGGDLEAQLTTNPNLLKDPRFLLGGGLIAAVGEGLQSELPDDAVSFRVHTPEGLRDVWIGGTLRLEGAGAAVGGNFLMMDLKPAMDCLGWSAEKDASNSTGSTPLGHNSAGRISRIDVLLEPAADRAVVQKALQHSLSGKAAVHPPKTRDTGLEDVLSGIQTGLTLGATVALFVGMFLVYNTLSVAVAERRHEIGILRTLGGTRVQIRKLFALEAGVMGIIGSIAGIFGGIGLARLSLGSVENVLQQQFSSIEITNLAVPPSTIVFGLVAGISVSLVAGLAPAISAAGESPSDSLRRVPLASAGWRSWWLMLSALVIAGSGVAAYYWLPGRGGSLASAYAIGFSFMLATPVLARWGVAILHPVASRLLGAGGRLAADDLVRSPARTGLTVGALSLGLAMTIETGGLIVSTEEPLVEWLEKAIRADLLVTSGSAITGGGEHVPMDAGLREALIQHPQVEDALLLRMVHIDYGPTRVLLFSLPIETYLRHTEVTVTTGDPLAWERMSAGGQVALISDNFAAQYGVQPGDELVLQTPRGPLTLNVLATILEMSWNRGSIVIDRSTYMEWFGDSLVDSFDLYLAPNADADTVRRELHDSAGKEHDLVILTNSELQHHVRSMVDQFYFLFYANGFMALAVSFLGVANTLAISVLHRRREIGLLRAVGATRGQIAWSVAAQALIISFLGMVLGIGLGMVLEIYVLRVLVVEESGFLFPFLFPTTVALLAAAFTLAGAQVAGALPASQAAYQSVSEAIAYE